MRRRGRSITVLAALLAALILLPVLAADAKRFKGTSGDDKINGTKSDDKILGRKGDDKLKGRDGRDKVFGGGGEDKVVGGGDRDIVDGGGKADKVKDVDGVKDRRISGAKGDDICIADFVDVKKIDSCETIRLRGDDGSAGGGGGGSGGGGGGGSGGGGGGGSGGGGGGSGSKLVIAKAEVSNCQSDPSGFGSGCELTMSGTGATAPGGSISVMQGPAITGGGGAQADTATGEWDGSGAFTCSEAVAATVTIGDRSASAPLPCGSDDTGDPGGGGGGGGNEPLVITGSTGLEGCTSQPPSCAFTIEGTGADGALPGTVSPNSPNVFGGGGGQSGDNGIWSVEGQYGCSGDGSLTVTFGQESVNAPVDCAATGGGGGEGNGPLTITTIGVSGCQGGGFMGFGGMTCQFNLAGGGADLPSGAVQIVNSSVVTGGGAVTADPTAGGAWTATGQFGCQNSPSVATVTVGSESATGPVPCSNTP